MWNPFIRLVLRIVFRTPHILNHFFDNYHVRIIDLDNSKSGMDRNLLYFLHRLDNLWIRDCLQEKSVYG